jgi:hypothetical protein
MARPYDSVARLSTLAANRSIGGSKNLGRLKNESDSRS